MPPFGEMNEFGMPRWQTYNLTAIDVNGHVWALCWDSLAPFDVGTQRKYVWMKFDVEAGRP